MGRCFRLLALGLLACATTRQPQPDPDAMREATAARESNDLYTSPRAYQHYLDALLAREKNDHAQAARELHEALIYDPQSAHLRAMLAQEEAMLAQFDRAEADARAAVALDPHQALAHLLLGKLCAASGRSDEAVTALETAAREAPRDSEAYRLLIHLAVEQGHFDQAETTAQTMSAAADAASHAAKSTPEAEAEAVQLRREEAQAWEEIGSATASQRSERDRAERAFRRAAERDPSNAELHLALAHFLDLHRRWDDAAAQYQRALSRRPGLLEVRAALVRILVVVGDLPAARAHLAEAIAVDPEDPESRREVAGTLVRFAGAFLQIHQPADALRALDRSRQLAPDLLDAQFQRGVALAEAERWTEAEAAFARLGSPPALTSTAGPEAAEIEALTAEAQLRRASCRSHAGHHAEALQLLSDVLHAHPQLRAGPSALADAAARAGEFQASSALLRGLAEGGNAEATIALASLEEKAGRPANALELLQHASVAAPQNGDLLLAVGAMQEHVGRQDDALASARAALALDPDNALAMNFVGYTLTQRGEKLDEAEALLTEALERRPMDGAIADSLGFLELIKGQVARAVQLLEQADRLEPKDAEIEAHLAQARRRAAKGP